MSYYDNWLLEGSEGEPWNEDTAPHGLCDYCEQPMEYADSIGEFCMGCGPIPHEAMDLRASFVVTGGRVEETAS